MEPQNMITLPPKYLKPIYMNINSTDIPTTTTSTTDYAADYTTSQNYQFESATNYETTTNTTTSYEQPTFSAEQSTFTTSGAQPAFKLIRRGSGITLNEQNGIVSTAINVIQSGLTPLSNKTAQGIKKNLGGDWLVIVYPEGKSIDFNMTCVQGNDYLYFTLDNNAFQVCRLR